ncbi:MAG: hypothetical protein KDB63_11920, partial [Nocardioidaceae bacterium]|nr:hypothetical protein [Nocardioidaceae bacterium]
MDLYSARHAQHGQQQLAAEGEVSTVPRQPIAPDEAPLAERLQQPTSAQPPLPPGAEAMPPPVLQGPVVQGP